MATGVVATFDERAGWGTIADDDGGERFFHAVAVADGSRTIAEGRGVEFDVVPGLLGRWEADSVRVCP
jgi:cold shock CspA family protein